MMENDPFAQLIIWHQEREHEKIVDRIMEIRQSDRDYETVSLLARAMNNLERYDEALQQLLAIAKLGENDPLWHFRVGYSYYYLKQYEEALREFEISNKLDPKDGATLALLNASRGKVDGKKKKPKKSAALNAMNEQTKVEKLNSVVNVADKIKPFMLIEHDNGSASVILNVGTYKNEIFQSRKDEGFEGGGYDWGSLAAVFLEEKMPEMVDIIHLDPEASMFSAYSDNREAIQSFVLGFKDACEDDDSIRDLFSRAVLD